MRLYSEAYATASSTSTVCDSVLERAMRRSKGDRRNVPRLLWRLTQVDKNRRDDPFGECHPRHSIDALFAASEGPLTFFGLEYEAFEVAVAVVSQRGDFSGVSGAALVFFVRRALRRCQHAGRRWRNGARVAAESLHPLADLHDRNGFQFQCRYAFRHFAPGDLRERSRVDVAHMPAHRVSHLANQDLVQLAAARARGEIQC
jgi:hypothetical protein